MNKILEEIQEIIEKNINIYLPKLNKSDLEENGKIYYINSKNGTEFDWYVNEHLPSFMVFYNDKNNLGAVKLSIYQDGAVEIYIYGDKGKKVIKKIETHIEITKQELFNLAIILKNETDDKGIWDTSIDRINTNIEITEEQIAQFIEVEEHMEQIKAKKAFLNKKACVSNKILKEGWKVGYMYREEPLHEDDSGWSFFAGDEDEEYSADYKNITLLSLYEVNQIDPDIWDYIEEPVNSVLIRISSNEFEIDQNDKEIYMAKRKN